MKYTSNGSVMQAYVLSSQLSSEESQTAAIAFGPDGSNQVVYSSPMLQEKLLVYDYQQRVAVSYIAMQHHMSALCGPLPGGSLAFADAIGALGLLDLATGGIILLQGDAHV